MHPSGQSVPFAGKLFDPRSAHADDGKLGSDEQAVQQDEEGDNPDQQNRS